MSKPQLTSAEHQLLRRHTAKVDTAVQLSGQPTTNLRDFFKRLFSKKLTVISLLVFLIIVVVAIIISATSAFGPEGTILIFDQDSNSNVPPKTFLIGLLPPTWQDGGNVEKIVTGSQAQILQDLQADGMRIIGDPKVLGSDRVLITFNPYDYFANEEIIKFGLKPNFILGTNTAGQDNWTRVWAGTLQSLELALLVATVETFIGVVLGAYLGFHAGSRIDNYFMRLVDSMQMIPQLLLFILVSYLLPPGFWTLFLALTIFGWFAPLYQTRMYVLRVKNLDFIRAAKTVGVPKWKLIYKYGLPQSLGRILAQFVRRVPLVIFYQASLAFLGFSSADDFNLGAIISDAKSHLDNVWYLLTPTLLVFVITLSLQFISNGVNTALEPKVGK